MKLQTNLQDWKECVEDMNILKISAYRYRIEPIIIHFTENTSDGKTDDSHDFDNAVKTYP